MPGRPHSFLSSASYRGTLNNTVQQFYAQDEIYSVNINMRRCNEDSKNTLSAVPDDRRIG